MPDAALLNQVRQLAERASTEAEQYSGTLASAKAFIVEHFGQNGLLAAYVVIGVIILLVVAKLAKTALSTVKYLVIPAFALALLAMYLVGWSFYTALPVTVTACALLLLFKG